MPVTQAYYYGWVTSMRVGAYDDEGELREIGTVSSGMTHELQESAGKDPAQYYGKVVKLAGMEKDRTAKTLRHFYFKLITSHISYLHNTPPMVILYFIN